MELIDSHCHLKGFKDKGELDAVLERAHTAGVQRFITVGTSPKDWVAYREMSAAYAGKIDYTVGLHPCYVDAEWRDAVSHLSTFFMPPHAPSRPRRDRPRLLSTCPKTRSKRAKPCSIRRSRLPPATHARG